MNTQLIPKKSILHQRTIAKPLNKAQRKMKPKSPTALFGYFDITLLLLLVGINLVIAKYHLKLR